MRLPLLLVALAFTAGCYSERQEQADQDAAAQTHLARYDELVNLALARADLVGVRLSSGPDNAQAIGEAAVVDCGPLIAEASAEMGRSMRAVMGGDDPDNLEGQRRETSLVKVKAAVRRRAIAAAVRQRSGETDDQTAAAAGVGSGTSRP